MPQPITSVNDFVVKFANVNGSGSASANALFAKSVLRMGVPASSRNIFPSNIQGLPTWFEVRISEDGYLGRRGGVDMMVAMNPQTWSQDIAEIEPGGYLLYDSTRPMPANRFRDDINVIVSALFQRMASRRHRCARHAGPACVMSRRNLLMSHAPVGQRSAHNPQCRQTSSSLTMTRPVFSESPI